MDTNHENDSEEQPVVIQPIILKENKRDSYAAFYDPEVHNQTIEDVRQYY